jgi:DNA-binding cell septation regulator SpoVG|tara:strand:- start:5084 stop:5386 length:303 start_codon:yes stop_codon:yes gene_type:complete
MKINKWKEHVSNTMQGFADIELENGIVLKGCIYHVGEESSWISLPTKPFKDKESGQTKYQSIVAIPDKAKFEKFQSVAVKAMEDYLGTNGAQRGSNDVPF